MELSWVIRWGLTRWTGPVFQLAIRRNSTNEADVVVAIGAASIDDGKERGKTDQQYFEVHSKILAYDGEWKCKFGVSIWEQRSMAGRLMRACAQWCFGRCFKGFDFNLNRKLRKVSLSTRVWLKLVCCYRSKKCFNSVGFRGIRYTEFIRILVEYALGEMGINLTIKNSCYRDFQLSKKLPQSPQSSNSVGTLRKLEAQTNRRNT